MTKYPRLSPFLWIFVRMWESLGTRLVLSVTLPYPCTLTQTFVTCSTNVKGWMYQKWSICYQATMVAVFATLIGGGTCNNIPKINITIVQSYTENISLICCLCCTLVTMPQQQSHSIHNFVLSWYKKICLPQLSSSLDLTTFQLNPTTPQLSSRLLV